MLAALKAANGEKPTGDDGTCKGDGGGGAAPTAVKKKGVGKGWAVLRKKRSGLARLAAFDRARARVHEIEHCEHLIEMLSSEVMYDRKVAVEELIRAGLHALPYLDRVCALMHDDQWFQRMTGVDALGSIASSAPNQDRLAQTFERLHLIEAEISATTQRYFRLLGKKTKRRGDRIDIAVMLLGLGHPLPPGVTAQEDSDDSDDEGAAEDAAAAKRANAEAQAKAVAKANARKSAASPLSLFGAAKVAPAAKAAPATGALTPLEASSGGSDGMGGGVGSGGGGDDDGQTPLTPGGDHTPLSPDGRSGAPLKPKESAAEVATREFVKSQHRLMVTARRVELGFKQEMADCRDTMLALGLERTKTRDEVAELEAIIASAKQTAMSHGAHGACRFLATPHLLLFHLIHHC